MLAHVVGRGQGIAEYPTMDLTAPDSKELPSVESVVLMLKNHDLVYVA